MLTILISAFILGLIFNAAPGPVFAETIRRGVRGGFTAALAVQIGSIAGDALWAILGLAGVGLLLQLEFLRVPVGIAGTVYLAWLAWDAWQESAREWTVSDVRDTSSHRKELYSGVVLSLTNPQNIAYWAAVGSALGALGVQEPTPFDYSMFFIGFMASSIVWVFFCAAMVDRIFRRAGIRWARVTYRLCAVAFLALALSSLRELLIPSHLIPTKHEPGTISGDL